MVDSRLKHRTFLIFVLLLSSFFSALSCASGSIVRIDGPAPNPWPIVLYPGFIYGCLLSVWMFYSSERRMARLLFFVICSGAAYFVAVELALMITGTPAWAMGLSGGVGALLLGLALKFIIRPFPTRFLWRNALIGICGGFLFYLGMNSDSILSAWFWPNPLRLSMSLAFAGWQLPVGIFLMKIASLTAD